MKKNVIYNMVMLYGLSIAKIVFPLVTLPYLARVLSTTGYGTVAYVKSMMQYVQLFIDFGFMLSGTKHIVEVRQDKKQLEKVACTIMYARITLGIFAFFMLLVLSTFIEVLQNYRLFVILSFVPPFLTIFLFDYLFRGVEQMQIITARFISMKLISTILTFCIVRSDNDILLIPIIDILGSTIAIVLVFGQLRRMQFHICRMQMDDVLRALKESFIYFMSNISTTAFGALNTIIIGLQLSMSEVAYWSICMQLIGGIQALYNPIMDGIYPEMVKTKMLKMIRTTLAMFMPLILCGTVFSYFISPYVLRIVGGEQYVSAAYLFRILLGVVFFSFPAMLFGWPTLGAFGLQTKVTITTVATSLFQISGIILLVITGSLSLVSLAVLRVLTEFFLLSTRLGFTWKYVYQKEKIDVC